MSKDTRATGALIVLAVDGIFLGSLLYIRVAAERQYVDLMRGLGVEGRAWPDAGGAPGALFPWAAAGAAALAALLARLRSPVPPLLPLAAAILLTAVALVRMEETGAAFRVGRYGTIATILAWIWILHLLGAMAALARGARVARFLALQAAFGVGLAALVFPA
ncbi:MAG TPA: hypothetical protein VFY93_09975 [Planctomycetota bacterium]|nr:hypothetical protein [Planctomycetota bacterium]